MREYKRALPVDLAAAQVDGWEIVAAETFAGGTQVSWLLAREVTDAGAEPEPLAWLSVAGLGADELRVVARVIERLRMGRKQYGPLDLAGNPKDWRAEATEEFLDGAIYMAMQSLRERE